MSSIKQLIVNAIIKVSGENPALNGTDQPTADQARDEFIRLLLAELFPEDPAVTIAPSAVPAAKTPVVKEKKAKKTKVEPVVVEKVAAVVVSDPVDTPAAEPVPVAEAAAPVVEPETKQETPKKKRAPMSDDAKAAMKAKKEATLAAKKAGSQPVSPSLPASVLETSAVVPVAAAPSPPVKEKKPPKPKGDKPNKDVNLKKVDPTWKKHLKNADKEHAKDLEAPLLTYLNALSKEDFDAKKAEEHVADFIASRAPKPAAAPVAVVDDKVEAELIEVEFEGKTYSVNAETKRVYEGEGEYDDEVGWTNYKPVGYVGMAMFEKMTIDDE